MSFDVLTPNSEILQQHIEKQQLIASIRNLFRTTLGRHENLGCIAADAA